MTRLHSRSRPTFTAWLRFHTRRDPKDLTAARILALVSDLPKFPECADEERTRYGLIARGARRGDLQHFLCLWLRFRAFRYKNKILIGLARDHETEVWRVLLASARSLSPATLREQTIAIVRRCEATTPQNVVPVAEFLLHILDDVEHDTWAAPALMVLPA